MGLLLSQQHLLQRCHVVVHLLRLLLLQSLELAAQGTQFLFSMLGQPLADIRHHLGGLVGLRDEIKHVIEQLLPFGVELGGVNDVTR